MDDEETSIMDKPSQLKPAPGPGEKVRLGMYEVELLRYVGTGEWVILRAPAPQQHVGKDKIRVGEEATAEAGLRSALAVCRGFEKGVSGFWKRVCRSFETGVSGF